MAAEAKLDGKFLLRTSDPTLSAEDVALGYKQLLQVERAWRDMKTTLDLRPVFHRKEERIQAHVLLCCLDLLLIRIAENGTGQTWHLIRWELDKMHIGRFSGRAGLVQQRTETTPSQRTIFRALGLDEPPRFLHLEPADPVKGMSGWPTSRSTRTAKTYRGIATGREPHGDGVPVESQETRPAREIGRAGHRAKGHR